MATSYKKNALLAIAISLSLPVFFPSILIFLADPCHIFHKPLGGIFSHGFTGDARCQNAGLVNNYLSDPSEKFDSIFTGTSLSGNFLPEYIAEKTQWQRTLKLTLPGAMPVEQQIITERALTTGNVRHVFWEVFPYQFFLFPEVDAKTLSSTDEFPLFLYNKGRLDDYRYLFRMSTLFATIGILKREDYYNISPIEKIDFWQHQCNSENTCIPFHNQDQIAAIKTTYNAPHFKLLDDSEILSIDFSAADRYLLATLLPYCNKETSFDLIFPPVSTLWFSMQGKEGFDYQLYMLRYVASKTAACRNIRVFAFNNESWITGDLAHYQNPRHFYGSIQNYIIDSIATGKHIITPENIRQFEEDFVSNVNNYVPWASTEEQLRNSSH